MAVGMTGPIWSEIAQFGEAVCATRRPAVVQQRALPDFARLLSAKSAGIQLLDPRLRATLASICGSPAVMLHEFESLSRHDCEYLRRSLECRFPVHDTMVHPSLTRHRLTPAGRLLASHGIEHCMLVPLIDQGRVVGSLSASRQEGDPPFTIDDQRLADRLGRFVAVGLANAAAYEAVAGPDTIPKTPNRTNDDYLVHTIRLSEGISSAARTARPHTIANLHEMLSAREVEVYELIATGLTNTEVAQELNIAVNTVKQHLKQVYRKLGVRS